MTERGVEYNARTAAAAAAARTHTHRTFFLTQSYDRKTNTNRIFPNKVYNEETIDARYVAKTWIQ